MHLRHQRTDPAYSFQRPCHKRFAQPILENLSRLIRAAEEAMHLGLGKISRERLRRARIQQLQKMNDRQLLDIGVERSEIAATVEGILEQKKRLT